MKTIIDFANKVKSLVDGRMSNIANVETSPSTHAYAVGKQLIFNGLLCKVTSAIAVGDTLAVGTNLALSDNVVEQIYSLNQGLTNSLADMNNVLGAKNLLPNNAESLTYGGITFTVNSDGSVTANGTASADTTLFLLDANRGSLLDDRGKSLVLSGRPTEGVTLNGGSCQLTVGENVNNTWVFHSDNGSGETFTLNSSRLQDNAYIWITSGVTLANAVFKPMLRPASIEDDTYVPYAMTNREMTPYVQAISNPNLLDNPWFTINQRGRSSYGANTFSLDRWRSGSNNQVAISGNVVTLSPVDTSQSCVFYQVFEDEADGLNGKTVTLSLLDGSGNLYTLSGTVVHNTVWTPIFSKTFNDNFTIQLTAQPITNGIYRYSVDITINATKTLTIKAVKLELGTISTLAMDTVPNYQQELAKCQRYFYRANMNVYCSYGIAAAWSTTVARMLYQTPVPMRVKPAIKFGDISVFKLRNGSTYLPITNGILYGADNTDKFYLELNATTVSGTIYTLDMVGTSYIDFSADL